MSCMNSGMGCGMGQKPQPCGSQTRPDTCQPCGSQMRPDTCRPCGSQTRPDTCQSNTPIWPVMPQPYGMPMGTAGDWTYDMQMPIQPAMPLRPAQPVQTAGMMQSKSQLMKQINEASFAMDDILLFLDTHPDNMEALQYYKTVVAMRKNAMAAYQRQFGPLLVDDVTGNSWSWVTDRWPWEGGCQDVEI